MLQKVIDKVNQQDGDKTIGLVQEGDIFFLVLNRADNDFDERTIAVISSHLDTVSKAKGARILLTIGTGPKFFSTGFSLKAFAADPINPFTMPPLMMKLLKKLLVLRVPTMCVMNGNAMAGGYIFALCHDYRILRENCKITLSEINIGLPLPGGYTNLVRELLPTQLYRKLNYGVKVDAQEML